MIYTSLNPTLVLLTLFSAPANSEYHCCEYLVNKPLQAAGILEDNARG